MKAIGSALKPQKVLPLILVLLLVSCQKEPIYQENSAIIVNFQSSSRSPDLEMKKVVAHVQWLINFVVPLVLEEEVYEDITTGNFNSPLVTSKLVSLGFSGFDDFTRQFLASGGEVFAAVNTGNLSPEAIRQILDQHIFSIDYSTLGNAAGLALNSPNLPCYHQFLIDLVNVLVGISIAAATPGGGPWAVVGVAVIGVAYAYATYKNCLRERLMFPSC